MQRLRVDFPHVTDARVVEWSCVAATLARQTEEADEYVRKEDKSLPDGFA